VRVSGEERIDGREGVGEEVAAGGGKLAQCRISYCVVLVLALLEYD
jgi:hypothetical protein